MIFSVFAVALLALLASGSAESAATDPSARMQQIIKSYVDDKSFMGTVLVVKDGKTLVKQGYGAADLEWNIPNTPAVKFRLGSVTKQFTAAGILLLQERGKLKVEDLIGKYLLDAPPAWQKIKIYNLLTHTSGIPNFTSVPENTTTQSKDVRPAGRVARFRDKPLYVEPGSRFSYSNSGYVLLGYLLEKISGQTYASFLRQNIFTTLGMTATGVATKASILKQHATGYEQSARGIQHSNSIRMTVHFAA